MLMLILTVMAGIFLTIVPAESTAGLTVQVRDRDGVIPNATVVLTHLDTGAAGRQVTDDQGLARFSGQVPGLHHLMVTYRGFADYIRDDIRLTAGDILELDVTLTLAEFSDTITVTTANRRVELLRNVPEPTTVIGEAEIEDTGARTAKDVLSEQAGSGVLVSTGGGQGHVSINGIPNSGVLVLVDGRRLLGKNGLGDLNLEDLTMQPFERIEVVKGAGSALYGSDALGGVINFITKKPTTAGYADQFNFSYGSYQDTQIGNSFSLSRGGFSGIVNASYRYYEGFDLDPENPQTIGQPESRFTNVSTNLEQKFGDRIILRGFAEYALRQIDNYFFTGATQIGEEVYNSVRDIARWTVSPEAEFIITESTVLSLRYTHSRYDREETRKYEDRIEPIQPWQEYNNELNVIGRQTWRLLNQEQLLQVGYEFRNEKMDRENLNIGGTSEADRDIHVVWAQNEFNVAPRFRFSLGFRYDDYSDFGDAFSPKVSAMVDFNRQHSIRFSYGHGFRAPNFGELYLDLGPFFRGNPALKPEISDNITAGYVFTGSAANVSFDYFHNRIQDGIVFDFSQFPFGPISYTNLREYTARGVNSSVDVNLPYGFTPSLAYTFVQREDPDGVEVRNYPKHSAFAKILWANPRYGLRANLRADINGAVEFEDGTSQPAYQVWKFHVSKKLWTEGDYTISAFFQVENIFDERDVFLRDAAGNPIPNDFQIWLAPRTFMVGLSFDLTRF
ncbi:MAG: TonB-dependent receptor [Acidobacteria bacterium]|nr:TonB-dependent receptor [Acidobacteriota bacterium]